MEESLILKVTDGGSTRVVQRSLQDLGATGDKAGKQAEAGVKGVGDAAEKTAPKVDVLRTALAGLAAYIGIRKIVEYSDAYTNLQNRLKLVTTNQNELANTSARLQEVANRTRADLEATGNMYARLAVALRTLGVSSSDTMKVTETLNEAIALSGATTVEALGGMIQLSQGLASGVLRGDELRSVLEQLPAVADIIATHMGVTRGRLRELGEQGAISAKQVFDALVSARTEVHDKFLQTISTVSQAFVVLGNNLVYFFGQLNQGTGVFTAVAGAIRILANHIGILMGVLLFATVLTIPRLILALGALKVAFLANPAGLFAVAIGTITAAAIELYNNIEDVELAFEGPAKAVAAFGGLAVGVIREITNALAKLPGGGKDSEVPFLNRDQIMAKFESTALKAGPHGSAAWAKAMKNLIGGLTDQAVAETVGSGRSQLELAMDQAMKNFEENFAKIRAAKKSKSLSEEAGTPAANPLVNVRALDDLRNELAMERELVGLTGFERKVAEDLGKLKIDMKRQHVDLASKEAAEALKKAELDTRELDTLRAKNQLLRATEARQAELDTERTLIGLYGTEKKIMQDLGNLREEMLRRNVPADEIQNALEEQKALLTTTDTLKAQSNILEKIKSEEMDRTQNAQNLEKLLARGTITLMEYNKALRESEQGTNTLAGAAEGLLRPFIKFDATLAATAYNIGTNLVNSLDSAAGAMADFASTGFQSWNNFREALANILADVGKMILKLIIQMLIMKAIQAGISAVMPLTGESLGIPLDKGGDALVGGGSASSVGGLFPGHAMGGSVLRGRPILVGENGPEIFTPPESGRIVPNGQLAGAPPVVNIHPAIVLDPKDITGIMNTPDGHKIILGAIQKNRTAVKGMVS